MPIMATARFRAVKGGKMKPSQFKFVELEGAPEFVRASTRHFTNLFEVPVLFYVVSLLCLFLNREDATFALLAWLYVAARFTHAFVHLTYNKVNHRFLAFFTSNIILIIFFIRLVVLINS